MLSYGDMVEWSRLFDLVSNRVGVCNQVLGCKYAHSPENPLVLKRCGKRYEIVFNGETFASFGVWDLESLRVVCDGMGAWSDCLWQLSRGGLLKSA